MDYIRYVHPMIIDRWVREMKTNGRGSSVIVHIEDNIGGELFDRYSHAVSYGFVKVVDVHNDGEDYEFMLTDEGETYIEFKLL